MTSEALYDNAPIYGNGLAGRAQDSGADLPLPGRRARAMRARAARSSTPARRRPSIGPGSSSRTLEACDGTSRDETCFERLNAATGADADLSEELGTWGSLSGGWNASSFESAASAPPSDPEPERLLRALVATHFTAFARFAASDDEALVGIDDGLAALSRHAQCRPPHELVPVGAQFAEIGRRVLDPPTADRGG